jgi:nitrosocyanin
VDLGGLPYWYKGRDLTLTYMSMNQNILIGGLIAIVVVVGAYFVLANRGTAPEASLETMTPTDQDLVDDLTVDEQAIPNIQSSPTAASTTTTPATTTQAAVKAFTVSATNFRFTPSEIRVKQGDTVRITLTNNSTMPHDWKVDAFGAATKIIQGGQQDTIEFVANKTGQFEYYCSVGNHRQMGMKGTLIVE